MPDAARTARVFKVLSVDTRVRIVVLLKERSLCVNALAKQLDMTPAAVSQHLRVLRDAGAVTGEKRGFYVHYGVSESTLAEWKAIAGELLGRVGAQGPAAAALRPSH